MNEVPDRRRPLETGHRQPPLRSDFLVDFVGDTVVLYDLDRGRMSVTNDAGNVVAALRRTRLLLPGQRLFYWDSMNVCDEILWNEQDGFIGFAPGPYRVPESALIGE